MMYQIDEANLNSEVVVDRDRIMLLRELLPEIWQERIDLDQG